MGILSRQAIEKRLESGELKIVPSPKEEDYDSDSVDVHLGDKVYEWVVPPSGSTISVSIWKKPPNDFRFKEFSNQYLREVPADNAGIITLRPQTFYLADLRQHTSLPCDVAMHIQGKSSLARLGVMIHITAPHAHAGWVGRLALEIYNLGSFNIEMKPDMVIGQLTFWKVEEPGDAASLPIKQFDNQKTARGA
jgi:dCTP deaminase